ncbi:hypothetical protein ACTA71_008922 [Dictyostelium dimigraforme]
MKIIIILTFFFIFFLKFGQSDIDPSQKKVLTDFLIFFGEKGVIEDPCSIKYEDMIKCVPMDSSDLSPLKNLTTLSFLDYVFVTPLLFENLYKFTQLEKLTFNYFNTTIPDGTIFPLNLKYVQIFCPSVTLGRSLFESSIKELYIAYIENGFRYPTLYKANPYIETLQLEVAFDSDYPPNLSQIFTNLKYLKIKVKNKNNQNQFYLPNTGVFNSLIELEFVGYSFQYFPINSLLSNVPVLENFILYGDALFFDPSKNLDLSYINGKNDLQFYTNSILENLEGVYFKFPKNAHFSCNGVSFSFNIIDFSNLSSFGVQSNKYVQNLPNIDNAPLLTNFEISFSAVVGNIPESYCRIKELSLRDDKLDGVVPSCIQCLGGKNATFVLPNPFSNFNENSQPYDCPPPPPPPTSPPSNSSTLLISFYLIALLLLIQF